MISRDRIRQHSPTVRRRRFWLARLTDLLIITTTTYLFGSLITAIQSINF